MSKMEIDLTPEQIEKVELLESNGISVGEAIDMLFEVKEGTLSLVDDVDDALSLFDKVKSTTLDVENKQKVLEDNYGDIDKSYEMKVQDVKHKISWAKDVFKF